MINRFLCARGLNYATGIIARLTAGGELEFVNCGHLKPLLISGREVSRLEEANLPVGMFPNAVYQSGQRRLHAGDRLLLVSDGLTEAEDSVGACFGDERLGQLAAAGATPDEIFAAIQTFCDGRPQADDCTALDVTFHG